MTQQLLVKLPVVDASLFLFQLRQDIIALNISREIKFLFKVAIIFAFIWTRRSFLICYLSLEAFKL